MTSNLLRRTLKKIQTYDTRYIINYFKLYLKHVTFLKHSSRNAKVVIPAKIMHSERNNDVQSIYSQMLEMTDNLIKSIISLGFDVTPVINRKSWMEVPLLGEFPVFSWHSRNTGNPQHFHLKYGPLPGYASIDSLGYSGWASIADVKLNELIKDIEQIESDIHYTELHSKLVVNRRSKYDQKATKKLCFRDSGRDDDIVKYIFYPMQLITDPVAKLSYIDHLSLLNELAAFASENSTYRVVVKRHPKCNSEEVRKAIEELVASDAVLLSSANIHDLIESAELVVTVNSGVGAESLLHLKPVICAGKADYGAACKRVNSVTDLRDVLNKKNYNFYTESEIKKFLFYYTNKYLVKVNDYTAIRERLRQILIPSR